ncbi:MAG: hypothetical protein R3C32_07100 [Chloroflexota bacterium]
MTGHAISLVSLDEEEQLKNVNKLLKRDLPLRQVRGFELDPRAVAPTRQGRSGSSAGRARGGGASRRPRAAVAR